MAKKKRDDEPKVPRAPGKGAWHEMLEERRKINDKYYEILQAQMARNGFAALYDAIAKDLKAQGVPRVPEKNNIHVLSLPTTIALVHLLNILEGRVQDNGEGTGRKAASKGR